MMKAVYRCCCGIDVHKKLIVACLKKGGRQEVAADSGSHRRDSRHCPAQRPGDPGGDRAGHGAVPQRRPPVFLGRSVPGQPSKRGETEARQDKTLKSMLAQCAKAAGKVKSSYFYAQYQRIAARRGKNRAAIAAAHSILTVIWHMLKYSVPYRDLGADYYDGFHREHKIKAYLKRLQALGWEPEPPAVFA